MSRNSDPAGAPWWSVVDPRSNLAARVALFAGGTAALAAVLLAWLASNALQRQLDQQLGAAFETLAFQISDKIDRAIYARSRELQFASNLAPLLATDASPDDRRRVLDHLQIASVDFAWIGLADPTGRIIAATSRIFEGTAVDQQPWFRGAREGPYVGALGEVPELAQALPETNRESRRFLSLAAPVLGANGRLIGVLGAYVHGSWARDIQLSVVPATAKQQRLGVTLYSAGGEALLDSGASGWSEPPPPPSIADPRRFRGTMIEPTGDGSNYLTGFVRSRGFRQYRGLGWLTVVRQPLEIAFAPVIALRRNIAFTGMLVSLTIAAGAWFFARRHTRRLRIIAAAADRIREGDVLTVIPSPRGSTELDHVCRAVGDLVEDLRPKADTSPAAPLAKPLHSSVERMQRSV